MSIFWLGGPEGVIVPEEDIKFSSDEDRYFLPGIIHGGEDYIIQVYYWCNGPWPEGDRIGAKYLFAESVADWAQEATDSNGVLDKEAFEELINENAEEFVVENDGTGDFVALNDSFDKSVALTYEEVIDWAQKQISKTLDGPDIDKPDLAGLSDDKTESVNTRKICAYKDVLCHHSDIDNLVNITVPEAWLYCTLEAEGETDIDAWFNEYTADSTMYIAQKALDEGVILGCDDDYVMKVINFRKEHPNLVESAERVKEFLDSFKDYDNIPAEIGFVFKDTRIVNPFYDETLRFEVEPFVYYGMENMTGYLDKLKDVMSKFLMITRKTTGFSGQAIKPDLDSLIADAQQKSEDKKSWVEEKREELAEKPRSEWTEEDWEAHNYCESVMAETDYFDSLDDR